METTNPLTVVHPAPRPSISKWIYTHNPFYAISAALMLFAVRAAYGTLEIGVINCWVMAGVLALYAGVLAAIGVLVVRKGRIWEDARSILLIVPLLLLAVSFSADDLLLNLKSTTAGMLLLLCGYAFSALASEAMLRGAGIRLPWGYRIPYHLMLALFFISPWWYRPTLHPRSSRELEWMLLLFPAAAALVFLCLLPAVRRGANYVASNGTPWPWPHFPWIAFAFIGGAFCLRSFTLCMTFAQSGPVWRDPFARKGIVFATSWGPYFLVPLGLALLLLVLEAGIVAKNTRLLEKLMWRSPWLLALSLPIGGRTFELFLEAVTRTIGSPLWLTTWALIGFYAWAWIRRVPHAAVGFCCMLLFQSIVGSQTTSFGTFVEPVYWPIFVVTAIAVAQGLWIRSLKLCLLAAALGVVGLWILLGNTWLTDYRLAICYHLLWLLMAVIGFSFAGDFARLLRGLAALLVPFQSLVVALSSESARYPFSWRLTYIAAFALLCLLITYFWRKRSYLLSFVGTCAVGGYMCTATLYRQAAQIIGFPALAAFLISFATLVLAVLISAHKARWLPPGLLLRWANGRVPLDPPPPDR